MKSGKKKSIYKDPLPTPDQVKAILYEDRAVRLRYKFYPRTIPKDLRLKIQNARYLKQRVFAQVRAVLNLQTEVAHLSRWHSNF